ncbi:oligopeptide/dipeptide ABC transporter ATPase [Neobacillus bataviensis LMG 21833]|uniref:Oligopeptide/dipeptide ABC transporter ATPase n=1 Tax=Neobacillus bataviensis LMG 21833 TaxID=1117379 RepID=K6BUW7_9BACI|nr:ABC transporter ATP-binding protein [Neobacillus bataviensis]EKN62720.1 oligopeptide/dipeptide ABC transporter ATPase [Neobacillus bataviensis LMG 21833]
MEPLLSVQNLKTYFYTDHGVVRSVDGVSFTVNEGETLGIVGESGSGKSVTALSILQLLPPRKGKIVDGNVLFKNVDLTKLNDKKMRRIRGNDIAMIFQEPMTSLNPSYTIGNQIGEVLRLHLKLSRKEAEKRSIELLKQVGISRAEKIVKEYPHRLSGGMRQRVVIAMALACNPKLIIADEPTTALDVTIQAQILELIQQMKKDSNTSIMMITHDLGVVSEVCDRVIVMYAGQVVEEADVKTIFTSPSHPYTKGLIESIPTLDDEMEWLETIPGSVPLPHEMPSGCKFASRCKFATEECSKEEPELYDIGSGQKSRCFFAKEVNHVITAT